jgi:hypothetical protein
VKQEDVWFGKEKGKLPNYESRQFLTILIVLYFMDRAERRQFLTILIVLYFMARIVSVCAVSGARLLRVCDRLLHVRDLLRTLPLCLQGTVHCTCTACYYGAATKRWILQWLHHRTVFA